MRGSLFFSFLMFFVLPVAAQELQRFDGCRLVASEWADGDSFSVKMPDGKEQTVRLYGVDCIEMHVQGDDSNARRLRDQRRYFGIGDILKAKEVGERAKGETARMLEQPFTLFTSFADGRGDGRFGRIYGFVRTAGGEDLSEWLVKQGLARAFGVVRQTPDGTSGNEWRQQLEDLELLAARAGRGAWAATDWEKLSAFRKEAREEGVEIEVAKGMKRAEESRQLDPNTAARDELMGIPGVGEKTADAIIGARPYKRLADLLRADGVGPATLKKMMPYLAIQEKSP